MTLQSPRNEVKKQHPNQPPNICYLGFPAFIRKQSDLSVTKASHKTTNSNSQTVTSCPLE